MEKKQHFGTWINGTRGFIAKEGGKTNRRLRIEPSPRVGKILHLSAPLADFFVADFSTICSHCEGKGKISKYGKKRNGWVLPITKSHRIHRLPWHWLPLDALHTAYVRSLIPSAVLFAKLITCGFHYGSLMVHRLVHSSLASNLFTHFPIWKENERNKTKF